MSPCCAHSLAPIFFFSCLLCSVIYGHAQRNREAVPGSVLRSESWSCPRIQSYMLSNLSQVQASAWILLLYLWPSPPCCFRSGWRIQISFLFLSVRDDKIRCHRGNSRISDHPPNWNRCWQVFHSLHLSEMLGWGGIPYPGFSQCPAERSIGKASQISILGPCYL